MRCLRQAFRRNGSGVGTKDPEGIRDGNLKGLRDENVKGMWNIPKYSNPSGITYSDEVVRRLAAMNTAADDFILIWDNAYCVHDLYEDRCDKLLNIYEESKKHNTEDRLMIFCSMSKVTFSGSAIAGLAASPKMLSYVKEMVFYQTIGFDKMNQLRHALYFKNVESLKNHMKKQADIIRPKFEVVLGTLEKELKDLECAEWQKPNGGYFISIDTMEGCAKRVVQLCKEAGVTLTTAGATYPYGIDPKDKNIRIAPTYPSLDELKLAIELFCISVKLASVEKLLK